MDDMVVAPKASGGVNYTRAIASRPADSTYHGTKKTSGTAASATIIHSIVIFDPCHGRVGKRLTKSNGGTGACIYQASRSPDSRSGPFRDIVCTSRFRCMLNRSL